MKITAPEKYKCDGCGQEQVMPHNWIRLHPLMISGMAFATTGGDMGSEYCRDCAKKMLAAVSHS